MKTALFFEEIPMTKIAATERELEKRLHEKELDLATKCHPGAAFIVVKMKKTNQEFVVARARRWDDKKGEYEHSYQILSDDCEHVVEAYRRWQHEEHQLFTIAVRLIRLNRAYKYFD